MFEKIKEAFSQFTFLGPMDLLQLAAIAKLKTVKSGEHIFKEGELNFDVVIVVKGLLRHYIIDKNGEEKTLLFVAEKGQSGMIETIFDNKPTVENVMALEDSILLKFDTRKVDKLVKHNIQLMRLQNQTFKRVISGNVEQIRFLTVLTPEERYMWFCKAYPNIEQRVKQKHLASYLGVTPTSLSRMRARLAKG